MERVTDDQYSASPATQKEVFEKNLQRYGP
jgi:hypothetical protein